MSSSTPNGTAAAISTLPASSRAAESLQTAIAALQKLPERTRDIFVLRRIEGHAYRDIASKYGISVSAVEKHMVRAVQHLAATV
jgi:RNA polymerase sigma-70 factor (ECF subfamily)